jgi:hypothetical protein
MPDEIAPDELERRLRDTGRRLPAPSSDDTAAARAAVIAATPKRRRPFAAALVLAAALLGAFGVGYAIAAGGTTTKVETRVVQEPLNAGPGFLPAEGWRTSTNLAATEASAVNAALGIRMDAVFGGATLANSPPEALLPLRLDDATPVDAGTRRLHVRVAAWDVDVRIRLSDTSKSSLAAAREELGRLVVPSCPAAQELQAGDVEAARRYVLSWLPAHYRGDPSETAGATATAHAGRDAPRTGQAEHYCGALVSDRTVEVDVVLPKLAKVSASLSQLAYFAARTPEGWTVWARAR